MIKAFFSFLLGAVVTVMLSLVLVVGVIEYLAGCGETYIDAEGQRHQNECIIIGGR